MVYVLPASRFIWVFYVFFMESAPKSAPQVYFECLYSL